MLMKQQEKHEENENKTGKNGKAWLNHNHQLPIAIFNNFFSVVVAKLALWTEIKPCIEFSSFF